MWIDRLANLDFAYYSYVQQFPLGDDDPEYDQYVAASSFDLARIAPGGAGTWDIPADPNSARAWGTAVYFHIPINEAINTIKSISVGVTGGHPTLGGNYKLWAFKGGLYKSADNSNSDAWQPLASGSWSGPAGNLNATLDKNLIMYLNASPDAPDSTFFDTQRTSDTLTLAFSADPAAEPLEIDQMDFSLALNPTPTRPPHAPLAVQQGDLDSDGDGLLDREETGVYNSATDRTEGIGLLAGISVPGHQPFVTDPYKADTDGDGLTDGQEVGFTAAIGLTRGYTLANMPKVDADPSTWTDPNKFDTDGDGYGDGPDVWVDCGPWGLALFAGEDRNANGKYDPAPADSILGIDDDEDDPNNPASLSEYDKIRAVDSDKDGLSDALEDEWGTNPYDADTDDDGVKDGDEVFIYHTNPNLADSDDDGLPDGFELGLTFPENPDGSNAYNSSFYDQINKGQIFYYSLPSSSQTYYAYSFQSLAQESYRSDPNNKDSDLDGVSDLLELEAGTDPMRGLVRNPDVKGDPMASAERLQTPAFEMGCAQVNQSYILYLDRSLNASSKYQWQAPLTISLGQSRQPLTLSLITDPPSPASPPYFIFHGQQVPTMQINETDLSNYMGQYSTAQAVLVCPDSKQLNTMKLHIEGGGTSIDYSVGVNSYYMDGALHDDYFPDGD